MIHGHLTHDARALTRGEKRVEIDRECFNADTRRAVLLGLVATHYTITANDMRRYGTRNAYAILNIMLHAEIHAATLRRPLLLGGESYQNADTINRRAASIEDAAERADYIDHHRAVNLHKHARHLLATALVVDDDDAADRLKRDAAEDLATVNNIRDTARQRRRAADPNPHPRRTYDYP